MKTGKLPKVVIEGLRRQIKQLHVDSIDAEAGKLEASEVEVVTQSADIVFPRALIAGAVVILRTLV